MALCSATAGTPTQRVRVENQPGKHWSLLIQISLASNSTEREHALPSHCLEVPSIWLKVRTWGWGCQKKLMGAKVRTSIAWILPQPLKPGLPWGWCWSSGCAAILNTKAKERAELRSSKFCILLLKSQPAPEWAKNSSETASSKLCFPEHCRLFAQAILCPLSDQSPEQMALPPGPLVPWPKMYCWSGLQTALVLDQ